MKPRTGANWEIVVDGKPRAIVWVVAILRHRGEAVACGDNGIPSFDLLRHRRRVRQVFLYLRPDRAGWRRSTS
jgi:hypothetical protein